MLSPSSSSCLLLASRTCKSHCQGRSLTGTVGVSEAPHGHCHCKHLKQPIIFPQPICFSSSDPHLTSPPTQIPGLLSLEIPTYSKLGYFFPLIPYFFLIYRPTLLIHNHSPPCYAPAQSLPTPFQFNPASSEPSKYKSHPHLPVPLRAHPPLTIISRSFAVPPLLFY